MLMIVLDLDFKYVDTIGQGNVLQTYIQFKDWDQLGTNTVPSWMNFMTSLIGTSVTKYGTCGPSSLLPKRTGPYTNIKGETDPNGVTCDTQAILDLDINGGNMLLANNFVQTFVRPFDMKNLSQLKLGSTVTYQAGFNIWNSAQSTQTMFSGQSETNSYTVVDLATSVLLSATVSIASALVMLSFWSNYLS